MSTTLERISGAIRNWWILLLFGILFVLAGFWVFRTPAESYVALSMLFALTFLLSGIGNIVFALSNRDTLEGWGWQLGGGILELLLGIALISRPAVSMMVLPLFFGFWLMFRGILTIAFSLELKKYEVPNWGWMLALGVVLAILAFVVLINPVYGASMLVTLTGISLLMIGFTNILISLRLRRVKRRLRSMKEHAREKFEGLKNDLEAALTNEQSNLPAVLGGLRNRVDEALKDFR